MGHDTRQTPYIFIVLTIPRSSISTLSSHFVFHIGYYALYRVLSYAPTAPSLPLGNPVQSFYNPWSNCGLYYCFLLSALISTPSLSDFQLPYPFRKGLFLPRFCTQPHHDFLFHIRHFINPLFPIGSFQALDARLSCSRTKVRSEERRVGKECRL